MLNIRGNLNFFLSTLEGWIQEKKKIPECPFVMELASSKLWIGKQAAKERNKK